MRTNWDNAVPRDSANAKAIFDENLKGTKALTVDLAKATPHTIFNNEQASIIPDIVGMIIDFSIDDADAQHVANLIKEANEIAETIKKLKQTGCDRELAEKIKAYKSIMEQVTEKGYQVVRQKNATIVRRFAGDKNLKSPKRLNQALMKVQK